MMIGLVGWGQWLTDVGIMLVFGVAFWLAIRNGGE